MRDFLRRYGRTLVRLVVVGALALWLIQTDDLSALGAVWARLPLWTLGAAVALGCVTLCLAAVRWQMLMRAFGVETPPPVRTLLRLVFVGHFYNTFVPGAVGGDVVRGVIMRNHFETPWASYVVVVLERLIGLSALGVVLLAGLIWGPALLDRATVVFWVGVLVGLGVLIVAAALLTGRLQALFRRLPRVVQPSRLLWAFGISLPAHGLSLLIFGMLVRGLDLPVTATDLLLVVPLGLVASFVPIAIVGIGPREAALVGLLGLLGVPRSEALGLSLAYAGMILVLAVVGGVVQLIGRSEVSDGAPVA